VKLSRKSLKILCGIYALISSKFSNQVRVLVPNANFILHPEYDRTLIRNDIAVIRLTSSVSFNAQIQPVTLPTWAQAGETFDPEPATISGWGRYSDGEFSESTILKKFL
jgi:Trypsin